MNKKHLVVCIGGASNSSTDNDEQIKNVVKSCLAKYDMSTIVLKEFSSLGNKRDINDWFGRLNPNDWLSLTVFGKSLGGVRLMQAYHKSDHVINRFYRVSLVFIDAHSPIPNYYGAWRGFSIDNTSHGINGKYNVKGWNIFQRNDGPEGCSIKFKGPHSEYQERDKNVGHFNIVTYSMTKWYVEDALTWAIGK